MCVFHADHDSATDPLVGDEAFFDFEGVDIFAAWDFWLDRAFHCVEDTTLERIVKGELLTSNDDILESSGNRARLIVVHYRFITRMKPQDAIFIADHDLVGLLLVPPVAALQLVSRDAEFSALANRHCPPLAIDYLCVGVRHDVPYGSHFDVYGVVVEGVETGWRGFCQAWQK